MLLSNKGFTLVELAIVMVIIGLLIGGILKGQEFIAAARVKAVITQVKGYQGAVNVYTDKYNALPGDDRSATTKLAGCNAANFCINGDGNGRIGATTTNYSRDDQSASSSLPDAETTMFWKHLALADMIEGIDVSSNPVTPVWGVTHPVCKGCGGFHVAYVNETAAENFAIGHYLILRRPVTGDPHPVNPGDGAVSPLWAYEIDNKIDDSNAKTGFVRSDAAAGICSSGTSGEYVTGTTLTTNCLMIFKMN